MNSNVDRSSLPLPLWERSLNERVRGNLRETSMADKGRILYYLLSTLKNVTLLYAPSPDLRSTSPTRGEVECSVYFVFCITAALAVGINLGGHRCQTHQIHQRRVLVILVQKIYLRLFCSF